MFALGLQLTRAIGKRLRATASVLFAATFALSASAASPRLEIVWPTPHTGWVNGKSPRDFLQHAGSGDPETGGFGGVRSQGTQFHEGIDIKPVARDRRGEATDDVFAAMAGIVRHVNSVAGNSSYGRYIVLEHPEATPAVYTLYAHLARVAPGIRPGVRVSTRGLLGTMGRSAGGYAIPKDRAHLHFEIGVMVTQQFQTWYNRQKFGSRNDHGVWNGMNLLGLDPLDFFNAWRDRRVSTFADYFAAMEPVVRLRIATTKTPDFVTRYPALLRKPLPAGTVAGWEIQFNWSGIPFSWTPLTPAEVSGLAADRPKIVSVNSALERRERSKSLALSRRGEWIPGKDLESVLEQLFGIAF